MCRGAKSLNGESIVFSLSGTGTSGLCDAHTDLKSRQHRTTTRHSPVGSHPFLSSFVLFPHALLLKHPMAAVTENDSENPLKPNF